MLVLVVGVGKPLYMIDSYLPAMLFNVRKEEMAVIRDLKRLGKMEWFHRFA